MKTKPNPFLCSASLSVSFVLSVTLTSHADSATWDGSASGAWNSNDNWSAATFPNGSGQVATFDADTPNSIITLGADITITSIKFNTGAEAYTFNSGYKFILGGGGDITVASGVTTTQTINTNLQLGGNSGGNTYNLVNESTTVGQSLIYGGNITGGTTGSSPGAKNLAVSGAGNTLISGAITKGADATSIALTKTGNGTLTLSSASNALNTVNANGGVILISGSGIVGSTAALAMGGGQFNLGGTTNRTVGAVTISSAYASGDTITNGSLTGTSYSASNTSGNAIVSANLLVNGSAGFTMNGAGGTVTLSGSNTYTGTTTISAGTLVLSGDNTSATGAVSVTSTLQLGNVNAVAGSAVTLNNGSTLQLRSDTNNATFNLTSFGTPGAGITIDVDRASTGTGNTLALSQGLSSNSSYTVNVTGANGYKLSLPSVTQGGASNRVTLNPTTGDLVLTNIISTKSATGNAKSEVGFSGAGNTTVTGAITASGARSFDLFFNQTGTVTLGGAFGEVSNSTYASQINKGTLVFKNATMSGLNLANIGSSGNPLLILDNQIVTPGTSISLDTNSNTALNGDFTFGSASTTGALTLGSVNLGTVAGATRTITVAGLATNNLTLGAIGDGTNATTPTKTLTKDGIGILTLGSASTYTGGTIVNGGTLAISTTGGLDNRLGDTSGSVTLNGGTLRANATLNLANTRTLNIGINGGATSVATGYTMYIGAPVSGAGNTMTVNGDATNAVTWFQNTVRLDSLVLGNSTTAMGFQNTDAIITNAVAVGSGQQLNLDNAGSLYNTASIYSGFSVSLSGGGTLRSRSGANTFDNSVTLTGAGTLQNRYTNSTNYGSMTIASGRLALGANTLTVDSPNAAAFVAIQGGITGTSSSKISLISGGQLQLSGTNSSFAGSLSLTSGEAKLGSATALSSSNAVNFVSNSNTKTLTLDGNSQTIGGLTTGATVGTSTIQNANAADAVLNVDLSSGSNSFGGVMTDGTGGGKLGLKKSGSGTLSLSGTNTYTGTTNVSSGILAINGDQSAATGNVSVDAGATLKGTGTVGGATTFAAETTEGAKNGGIHSPGASVGKQTFDASDAANTDLSYAAGSIFEWELGSIPAETNITKDESNQVTASNRGIDYDAVNVTGTLGGSGAVFRIVLDGEQTFADAFWNQDRQWTDIFRAADHAINQTETASLNIASIFSSFQYYNSNGAITNTNITGRSFTITGSTLTWSAVPEPNSALVGLLVGAGLLRRRRAA